MHLFAFEWIWFAKELQAATTEHSCSLSSLIARNIISPKQDHSSKGKVYSAIIQNPQPDILDSSVTHCFASGADRSFFVVMDAFAITHHTGSPLPSSCFTGTISKTHESCSILAAQSVTFQLDKIRANNSNKLKHQMGKSQRRFFIKGIDYRETCEINDGNHPCQIRKCQCIDCIIAIVLITVVSL